MKILNLLMWVGQFGLSTVFPTVFFLLVGAWLQQKFALGSWILILFGLLGLFSSFRTAKVCLHSLRKAAEEISDNKNPPISFNQHQ